MVVEIEDILYSKLIGVGSEGIVYNYQGKALKYLNNPTINKETKIKMLKETKNNSIVKPIDLIYDENEKFIGYTMEMIQKNNLNIKDKINNSNSLKEKIEILKKQEEIMKTIHKDNMKIIDFNYSNFIYNKNEIKLIDSDNFYVENFPNDNIPLNYYKYYCGKVSNSITNDIDIMSNTLNMLWLITEDPFLKKELLIYNNNNYIEEYIKKLILPKEAKSLLLEIVSDSVNKPYINNDLDVLMTEEKLIKKAR